MCLVLTLLGQRAARVVASYRQKTMDTAGSSALCLRKLVPVLN
jgi:hypothetical protein